MALRKHLCFFQCPLLQGPLLLHYRTCSIFGRSALCRWVARKDLSMYPTISSKLKTVNFLILIPPSEKFVDLLLLINILEIQQNAVVKSFRVGGHVRSGKNGRGTECKADLSDKGVSEDDENIQISYLSSNVCDWCWSDARHTMYPSISRTSSLIQVVHWAGRCEYMLISLEHVSFRQMHRIKFHPTNRNQDWIHKQALPWILAVELLSSI